MSAGDCICPGEELTFEGLTISRVCSLVDLTVSPVTWNNVAAWLLSKILIISLEEPSMGCLYRALMWSITI